MSAPEAVRAEGGLDFTIEVQAKSSPLGMQAPLKGEGGTFGTYRRGWAGVEEKVADFRKDQGAPRNDSIR